MNKILKIFIILIFFIATSCSEVFADTRNWIGVTSQAWNTASNWQGGAFPANGDDVVIDAANYPVGHSPI